MLVELLPYDKSPAKLATIIRYADPLFRNAPAAPPAFHMLRSANDFDIGHFSIRAVVFYISEEPPFSFAQGANCILHPSTTGMTLRSSHPDYHLATVMTRAMEDLNKTMHDRSKALGPVQTVPFFSYHHDRNDYISARIDWKNVQDLGILTKITAPKLWLGSLVMQHIVPTLLSVYGCEKTDAADSSTPGTPSPCAPMPIPSPPNNMVWIWYPEHRPSSLTDFINTLSGALLTETDSDLLKSILPLWSGFYRASITNLRKTKASAKVLVTYDDNPNAPMSQDAYLDIQSVGGFPQAWSPDHRRIRLHLSLPASVQDTCSGYEAWGFDGTTSMTSAFVLPYTTSAKTPRRYGPVRSSCVTSKGQHSAKFRSFSLPRSHSMYPIMTGILNDASECQSSVLDMPAFAGSLFFSASSTRGAGGPSQRAPGSVKRVSRGPRTSHKGSLDTTDSSDSESDSSRSDSDSSSSDSDSVSSSSGSDSSDESGRGAESKSRGGAATDGGNDSGSGGGSSGDSDGGGSGRNSDAGIAQKSGGGSSGGGDGEGSDRDSAAGIGGESSEGSNRGSAGGSGDGDGGDGDSAAGNSNGSDRGAGVGAITPDQASNSNTTPSSENRGTIRKNPSSDPSCATPYKKQKK